MSIKSKIYLYFALFILIATGVAGCNKNTYRLEIAASLDEGVYSLLASGKKNFDEGRYEEALNDYRQAEPDIQSGEVTQAELSNFYNIEGQCYLYLTDNETAIEYFQKSLEICTVISDEDGQMNNYMGMHEAYYAKGDYDKAIEYAEMAEKLIIKLYGSQSRYLVTTYTTMGASENMLGQYELALEHLQKALDIATGLEGEDSRLSAQVYLEIADVYQDSGMPDKQEIYLKKALLIYEEQDDKEMVASVYARMGKSYEKRDNQKAIDFYSLAIDLQKDFGNSSKLANFYYWRAAVYYYVGDYDAFVDDNLAAYKMSYELPIQSDWVKALRGKIEGNFKRYFENVYNGNKTQGFESWLADIAK